MKVYLPLLLLLIPFLLHSQPNLEWASAYTTANSSAYFGIEGVHFDSGGNIICGMDNGYNDWKVVKYDFDGNLLWDFSYEHADKIAEYLSDFLIDSEDNIIAVGSSTTQYIFDYDVEYGESELIVFKISPQGNLLWTYTKASEPWTNTGATCVDIDENNNIYLSGSHSYPGSFISPVQQPGLITIKLDTDGNQIWQHTFPSFRGNAIKYINNNILVAARSQNSPDFMHLKYDLNGNLISNNAIDSQLEHYFYGHKFDDLGNLYLYNSYRDFYKISKFDTNCNLKWYFEEPTNLQNGESHDVISHIDIDENSNVFITGAHYREDYTDDTNYVTYRDILSFKLNANGEEIWRNRYESSNTAEFPTHIETSNNGQTVVTGLTYVNGNYDNKYGIVSLLDENGNSIWFNDYDDGATEDLGQSSHFNNGALYVINTVNNEEVQLILNKYNLNTNCLTDLNISTPPNNGTYQVSNVILSNTSIGNTLDTKFYAGSRVKLNTGFNVEAGAKFRAAIQGCE